MSLILQATDLSVDFGGVMALDHFSIDVRAGEIHGVIGPNGAGKTTAINVLTGFLHSRTGQAQFAGNPLPSNPHLISQAGIGRTFQTPAIFPDLSAGENVMCAGHRWTQSGLLGCMFQTGRARLEELQLRESAEVWLKRVGFKSDFDIPMKSLPFGEIRKVEIARALMAKPRLLLLDEPTAGLTSEEVRLIATLLKSLQQEVANPLSVLIIEHNVPFIFSLCDRVTALDNGRKIETGSPVQIRRNTQVISSYLGGTELAVGKTAPPDADFDAVSVLAPGGVNSETESTPVILDAQGISAGYGRINVIRDLDLKIHAGELVVICGRNGAGKSTLLNALVGRPQMSSGEVRWMGQRIDQLSTSQIVRAGIALVPQERGVISEQTVEANLKLSSIGLGLSGKEFLIRQDEMMDRFPKLRARKNQLAGTLSGGERQMLALAKVLIRRPGLLLMDEPSIGLAPTVLEGLRQIIADISRGGIAVLVAEQNVWWIAALAKRAYLLESGAFVAQGRPDEIIRREQVIESFLGKEIELAKP
jgi:ABC-type branched-subunit amino acid transport system ATPase component